jgi:hypothetical protein
MKKPAIQSIKTPRYVENIPNIVRILLLSDQPSISDITGYRKPSIGERKMNGMPTKERYTLYSPASITLKKYAKKRLSMRCKSVPTFADRRVQNE